MGNQNISESESSRRFREAITNEYNKQVTEINQYIDLIENTLDSDDTILKLESLLDLQCDIIQSRNKLLSTHLVDIKAEIERLEILSRIGKLQSKTDLISSDLSDLLEKLKPYFQDCSLSDLETIIKHKQLPIGRSQILWTGVKADAIRFAEHFDMTKAQFNKIFCFIDTIKLHKKHRDKNGAFSPISDLLKKYPV